MRKLLATATLTAFSLTSVLAAAPSVSAEEVKCAGTLGRATVDNVRVPSGASCTLAGTRVQGTVKVERDATLNVKEARVDGNIQAEGHDLVAVTGSRVGGSIQLDQGGAYRIASTQVIGGIQVKQNTGTSSLKANTVNQDVQVFNHRAPGRDRHHQEPDRRQPPVQGERPGPDRRRQPGPGQQGGPVQGAVIPEDLAQAAR